MAVTAALRRERSSAAGDVAAPIAQCLELPTAVATLLAIYPLINAVASFLEASAGADRSSVSVLRVDATLSVLAAAGLTAAALAADAGGTLMVFGAWAFVSGGIQLNLTLSRRRATTARQSPMIISGTLSTIAGIVFALPATGDAANVAGLAGYAALYLVWASRAHRPTT